MHIGIKPTNFQSQGIMKQLFIMKIKNHCAKVLISCQDFNKSLYMFIYFTYFFSVLIKQAKNIWQAEIDAAAELVDFLRFNCQFSRVSHPIN